MDYARNDKTKVFSGTVKVDCDGGAFVDTGECAINIDNLIVGHVPLGHRVRIVVENCGATGPTTAGQAAYEGIAKLGGRTWATMTQAERESWEKTARAAIRWYELNSNAYQPIRAAKSSLGATDNGELPW